MDLKPGETFGPYQLISPIGEGGMGEVWKARDKRLDRDVALKVSKSEFTARFESEARAIAALNHPNICTLHDIGPNYLVMELVDGPTLAERIARGPIATEEALDIAKQLANALEAAHDKGIIHRDLKPANIKVRLDGSVKVLDFGLAKASEATTGVPPDSLTMTMTTPGTIMGTPGYMPPEQVRGEKVDKRADIWAFAVVLYEMLTGRRPFEGKSASDTIAAVIREEPDWKRAPLKTQRLLRRCLEKDPRLRLRDIGDAMALLDETAPATPPPSRSRHAGAAGWIAAAVFAVFGATLTFVHFREKAAEAPLTRLSIDPPERTNLQSVNWTPPAISPDGRQVVFEATSEDGSSRLWLRPLDSLTAQPLAGTEGGNWPFWSPDSKSIGFFASGKLKKTAVSGGPATALADATAPRGGAWNQNGVIIFAPTPYNGLQQVSSSGGAARSAIPADPKSAIRFPWFLPDGRHFVYMRGTSGSDYTIRIGSLDSPTDDRPLPGTVDSFSVYSRGYLLFVKGTTLVARPFDPDRLSFTGDAIPVAEKIKVGGGSVTGSASFSISGNGVLVYQGGSGDVRLTWLDRAGKRLATVGEAGDLGQVELSPDGRAAMVSELPSSSANPEIWLYDVPRGLRTRFTFMSSQLTPIWSPDGRTIVFRSNQLGRLNLYRKPADGSSNEVLLYGDDRLKNPGSFSPDSRYLAYTALDPNTGFDLWLLPDPLEAPGASKPYPFLQTQYNEQDPRFSPDGHWIAYFSNESSRNEVYVSPFPGPGGKRQVSTAGGTAPRWRKDGRELFYVAPDRRLMAAEVDARSGAFEVSEVDALFGPVTGGYDVASDGRRFLVIVPEEAETSKPLTIVQNWTAGLKK